MKMPIEIVQADPSDGFVDGGDPQAWIDIDQSTNPPTARLFLPLSLMRDSVLAAHQLTIASGAITVTGSGVYIVSPETGYADILTTIIGGKEGERIILFPAGGTEITLANATGAHPQIILPTAGEQPVLLGTGDANGVELMLVNATGALCWWLLGCRPTATAGTDAEHTVSATQVIAGVNASTTQKGHVKKAAYVDPTSLTFAADLCTALTNAGLMATVS